jgi:16S rRNA (guanine527-N7)-methyltransferase
MNDLALLREGSKELGLTLTSSQLKQLKDYKDYTLKINNSLNLTSIVDDKEFIIKHFLDSFTLSSIYDFSEVKSVMDMGTGAGIPGIPMKILYPEVSFVLADSLNKRIGFLKDVVDKLKLEKIDCIHGRAEELGQDIRFRESFDVVISRAVANLAVLSEYCIPFLKLNGTFLCLKGPKYKEEIQKGKGAILKLGGSLEGVESIKLPFSDITHYILIIKKIRHTPTKFPRKPGKPTKSPMK